MLSSEKSKLALVIPWFGFDIPGGAEAEAKELALQLQQYFSVEILTTCVKDFHADWTKNTWKEKTYIERGIPVRRFKVDPRDTKLFDTINYKAMHHLPITKDEEELYIKNSIRSKNLKNYILSHQDAYRVFLFIPYMFGITYDIIPSLPSEKVGIIPCLHDEVYAYFDVYKEVFSHCNYIFLHTNAEKEIAQKIFGELPSYTIVGEGVHDVPCEPQDPFTKRFHMQTPYILYAGRKDTTKNLPQLLEYFSYYQKMGSQKMQLVIMGKGDLPIPDRPDIIDVGFVSEQDKLAAMRESLCLCQPSVNESFSIVMMESWLQKRPVLVNELCAVTKEHCILSNGGLFYTSKEEFAGCIEYFLSHKKEASQMGENGYRYVKNNYSWDIVTKKYAETLQ